MGFPHGSDGKESTCNEGDLGLIPGLGRSPGEGEDYPLQYSVLEKNLALSINQCQLQDLQISEHLIDLLSILLRCNGFAGIQKAVVDQTGSRPPNSDHGLFLVEVWSKFGFLWSFFLLSWLLSVVV